MLILRAVGWSFLLAAGSPARQDTGPVSLRWKVTDAPRAYKASLKASASAVELDVPALARQSKELAKKLGVPGDVPPEFPDKAKEFFASLKLPDQFALTLLLVPAADQRISVKLIQNKSPLPAGDSPLEKMLKEMEGTVQLRGEIDASGAIASWWLQSQQKNLLALLCQLPPKAVKPGDAWALDVNLVQMGPGFIAEKAERTNLVRLAEIRKGDDGELLARLEYLLSESVEGEFAMVPGQKGQPSSMVFSFVGKAEFSITKGGWRSLVGRLQTKATGVMKSDASQDLALEPLPAVPEELLKLR